MSDDKNLRSEVKIKIILVKIILKICPKIRSKEVASVL